MQFEGNDKFEGIGKKTGFFAAFLAFATVLYFLLRMFGKMPEYVEYIHIITAVIVVSLAAWLIGWLKK